MKVEKQDDLLASSRGLLYLENNGYKYNQSTTLNNGFQWGASSRAALLRSKTRTGKETEAPTGYTGSLSPRRLTLFGNSAVYV
jgi:hypothetical protein